jgi:two-component system sensor histidine kinase YesM
MYEAKKSVMWRGLMRKKIVNKLYSLSVRKKIILFYLICVIFPLFVVDGLIASITYNAEKKEKMTSYENLAVAVDYALSGNFATIDEMVESVYLNRGIYNFLNTSNPY